VGDKSQKNLSHQGSVAYWIFQLQREGNYSKSKECPLYEKKQESEACTRHDKWHIAGV
jgi:hypothetical protein